MLMSKTNVHNVGLKPRFCIFVTSSGQTYDQTSVPQKTNCLQQDEFSSYLQIHVIPIICVFIFQLNLCSQQYSQQLIVTQTVNYSNESMYCIGATLSTECSKGAIKINCYRKNNSIRVNNDRIFSAGKLFL